VAARASRFFSWQLHHRRRARQRLEEQNRQLELTKAALARTARLLMDGNVYVR